MPASAVGLGLATPTRTLEDDREQGQHPGHRDPTFSSNCFNESRFSQKISSPTISTAILSKRATASPTSNASSTPPFYRARPDVQAVVHSHSPSIIPFGVTATPLRPVYHMSAFLGAGTPIFEIRQAAGMTDMLIRDDTLAAALAKSLAENPVVLMRGHGDTVVANSIPQVVYRAIYTEMNARLQAQAAALGTINFLSAEEAAKAAATNDGQVLRPWELWKARIGKID